MKIIKKVIPVFALGLIVSGCASTQIRPQVKEVSTNISYAPVIDIAYADVVADIDENIGTDVRWGGEVIESVQLNDSTVRLTVYGYPLSNEGRPFKQSIKARQDRQESGRFIVDLNETLAEDTDFKGHFVTFYGGVTSKLVVTTGNREKQIPIIDAQEIDDWTIVDSNRNYAKDLRGNAYYSLSYSGRHLGYRSLGYRSRFNSPYYSRSFRRGYSPRGFFFRHNRSYGTRGFSRFRRY